MWSGDACVALAGGGKRAQEAGGGRRTKQGVSTYWHQLQASCSGPAPGRPQGIVPTIRRISQLSLYRRSAGLAPVLGWCEQPFALSFSMGDASVPTPHNPSPAPTGTKALPKGCHQMPTFVSPAPAPMGTNQFEMACRILTLRWEHSVAQL